MDMSDNSAPAEGGKKVIILCEKVSKEDIKVRFFDYSGWEEWAEFGASGVHKQYAISLTVPRYIHISQFTLTWHLQIYHKSHNTISLITIYHSQSDIYEITETFPN